MTAETGGVNEADIIRWLSAEDIAFDRVDSDSAGVALKVGPTAVIKPQDDDRLMLVGSIALPQRGESRITDLQEPARSRLLRAIAVIIHSRTMKFRFLPDPVAPTSVTVFKALYPEILNRATFMQALAEVEAVTALVTLEISDQLGLPIEVPRRETLGRTIPKPEVPAAPSRDLRVQDLTRLVAGNGVQISWAPPAFDSRERELVAYEIYYTVVGASGAETSHIETVVPGQLSVQGLPDLPERNYGVRAVYRAYGPAGERRIEYGPGNTVGT